MLDLFSGIGGFSYAGEKLVGGYETVAFCEYDKHAQKVLRKHWPDTEIIDDVRELANDADRFRGLVDIVVGGYPCQPFSQAGKRLGDQDDRHLWPAMLAVIEKVRPTWVCGENVNGHIAMGVDTVLSDLEAANYTARTFVIPAVAADAPHRRDRCWIVAHTNSNAKPDGTVNEQRLERATVVGDTNSKGFRGTHNNKSVSKWVQREFSQPSDTLAARRKSRRQATQFWEPEPAVGRVANGIPGRVHRLKQLGNSIVPQVAARILWAIKEAHNG
jgi:DNA (cytosine-5)-methyltransferase 1